MQTAVKAVAGGRLGTLLHLTPPLKILPRRSRQAQREPESSLDFRPGLLSAGVTFLGGNDEPRHIAHGFAGHSRIALIDPGYCLGGDFDGALERTH